MLLLALLILLLLALLILLLLALLRLLLLALLRLLLLALLRLLLLALLRLLLLALLRLLLLALLRLLLLALLKLLLLVLLLLLLLPSGGGQISVQRSAIFQTSWQLKQSLLVTIQLQAQLFRDAVFSHGKHGGGCAQSEQVGSAKDLGVVVSIKNESMRAG
jgi:hypothetical protein